jgi:hypothetical protein
VVYGDGRPAVRHRDLALEDHVANCPGPARNAVEDLELRQAQVAGGVNRPALPLVGRQPHTPFSDDERGVQRREAEMTARRGVVGDHQEAVVAPRPESRDRPHCEAAKAVGDDPLLPCGALQVTA